MSERYDFSGIAVLIVDSNPFWARLLKAILGSMRINSVRACADAQTAWSELLSWTPDLIVVDLANEKIDGLRFIRAIRRRDNPARHCPVVMLTAHADARMVRRARNAGADYTLTKPFSVTMLYRALVALRNDKREFVESGKYYGPNRRRRVRNFVGENRRSGDGESDIAGQAA